MSFRLVPKSLILNDLERHHRPLTDTKLYCLVTEAHKIIMMIIRVVAVIYRSGYRQLARLFI